MTNEMFDASHLAIMENGTRSFEPFVFMLEATIYPSDIQTSIGYDTDKFSLEKTVVLFASMTDYISNDSDKIVGCTL